MSELNLFDVRDILYAEAEKPSVNDAKVAEDIAKFESKVTANDTPANNVPDLSNADLSDQVKQMIMENAREKEMEEHAIISDAVKPRRNPLLDELANAANAQEEESVSPIDNARKQHVEAAITNSVNTRDEGTVRENTPIVNETVNSTDSVTISTETTANADTGASTTEDECDLPVGSSAGFLADIKAAEHQFDDDPLVLQTIKDTQGIIKERLDKLGMANVPLEALFDSKTISVIDHIEGYDIYTMFGYHIAMKRQLRKTFLGSIIDTIKDSLRNGGSHRLDLKTTCVFEATDTTRGGVYSVPVLNQNEIAYLCSAFKLYNVRIDTDATMSDRLVMYVE